MLVSRTAGNRSNPWPGPWVQKSLEQLFELKLCNMHVIEEQTIFHLHQILQFQSKMFRRSLMFVTIHQQALRCVMHTKFCQLTSLWVNGFVVLNNLYKFQTALRIRREVIYLFILVLYLW